MYAQASFTQWRWFMVPHNGRGFIRYIVLVSLLACNHEADYAQVRHDCKEEEVWTRRGKVMHQFLNNLAVSTHQLPWPILVLLSIGGCQENKESGRINMDSGINMDTDEPDTHTVCLPQGVDDLLLMVEVDTENDGTVDGHITYTYDTNGNLIMIEDEYKGIEDGRQIYTYDSNGNMLTAAYYDFVGEGSASIYTYTYDANGNIVMAVEHRDDGSLDRSYTYNYDANGRLFSVLQDNGRDGSVDVINTYSYDDKGNLLIIEQDNDADGIVDSSTTYTYDAHGNPLTEQWNDSNRDYNAFYTYDANDNLIIEQWNDSDGTIMVIYNNTYDVDGNQLTKALDNYGDEVVDVHCSYFYQC